MRVVAPHVNKVSVTNRSAAVFNDQMAVELIRCQLLAVELGFSSGAALGLLWICPEAALRTRSSTYWKWFRNGSGSDLKLL